MLAVESGYRAARLHHEYWLENLKYQEMRYRKERSAATRAAYRQALKTFADLIVRDLVPKETDELRRT
jgi:hypothetical protein